MIGRYLKLRRAGVLGLNARNARYIMPHNPRRLYPLVDNKIRCKHVLAAHGIAVPKVLASIHTQYEAGHLSALLDGMERFVIKPASGSGGDGIVVVTGRRNRCWVSPGGNLYRLEDLQFHVSGIINGMYSLGGQADAALFEELIESDARLRVLAPVGVPDIRVIVFRTVPVMAMVRLPTQRSGGRANLHQGAIGAGIDLLSGLTMNAVMDSQVVEVHPDTGHPVAGFQIPDWDPLLEMAIRCQQAVGLGYLGVDIVIDARYGPQVLELNARPGLAIQIANQAGLQARLQQVEQDPPEAGESPSGILARMQRLCRAAAQASTAS